MSDKPILFQGVKGIVYSDPDKRQLICGDCDGKGKPAPGEEERKAVVAYYEGARNWFCDFYYWATHDTSGNPAKMEFNEDMFRAVYGSICSMRDNKFILSAPARTASVTRARFESALDAYRVPCPSGAYVKEEDAERFLFRLGVKVED